MDQLDGIENNIDEVDTSFTIKKKWNPADSHKVMVIPNTIINS